LGFETNADASSAVASYDVTPKGYTSTNYEIALAKGTLNVTPAPISVKANDAEKIYGAANPALGGVITGIKNEDHITALYTTAADEASAAGTYAIVPVLSGAALRNYQTPAITNGTLKVNAAALTVTTNPATKVYGDANPDFSVSYSGLVLGQDESVLGGTLAFNTSATVASAAGSYDVTPAGLTSANYSITFVKGSLSVTKASLTITADHAEKVYGDANPAFGGKIVGIKNNDAITASYSSPATQASAVGTYAIVPAAVDATPTKLANYNVELVNGALKVNAATLTVTTNAAAKVYGDANPALTGTITGIKNSDNITAAYATTATQQSEVGGYAITATLVDPTNKLGNYTVANAGNVLTVTKAPIAVKANDKRREYGIANPVLDGVITGIKNNDAITASFTTTATQASAVGTYAIVPALTGDKLANNYTVTETNGTLTVNRVALTVTTDAKSKVYGDANPVLTGTITGIRNSDAITAAYATAADANSAIGTYAITATLADPDGKLGNYTVTNNGNSLAVTKAPLTIAANHAQKGYGQVNPAFTGVITGIKNNDNITASYTTAANQASGVGTYAIVPAAVDASPAKLNNYTVTLVNGTLTVDRAPLTVTANAATKVYGQNNPAFSVRYSGFVNNDNASSLTGTLAYATSAVPTSQVGSYDVTPSGLTSANYAITFVAGKLEITPAALTVTTHNKTKVYGEANPVLDGALTGVVNGDGITASYSTTTTLASSVGTYPITAALNDPNNRLSNYTVTNTPGTLTVTRRALTVTANNLTVQYSDVASFSVSYNGFVSGDGAANLGGALSFTTTASLSASAPATVLSGKGTYTITPAGLTSGNYAITYGTGTLTVNEEDAEVVYSGLEYFATANSSSSTANVEYIATFTDRADGSRGVITNAQASFAGGTQSRTAPVALINANDPAVGAARTGVHTEMLNSTDFNNGGRTYELTTSAHGNFYTGQTSETTLITIAVPGTDFVNGGGNLVMAQSAGTYAATVGSKMNFGFTMKWNKSGRNIQGQANIIFRRLVNGTWRTYQIKSNAINTLGTFNVTGGRRADFNTKANVTDITNPLSPVSLGGGLDLTVQALESTDRAVRDRISVTVRNGSELVFSSSWNGSASDMRDLSGGAVRVRSSASIATTTTAAGRESAAAAQSAEAPVSFTVNAYPNPFADKVTLSIGSEVTGDVAITVVDGKGRTITRQVAKATEQGGRTVEIDLSGEAHGMYLLHVQSCAKREVIKVFKMNR
jgi:hypothetical protein